MQAVRIALFIILLILVLFAILQHRPPYTNLKLFGVTTPIHSHGSIIHLPSRTDRDENIKYLISQAFQAGVQLRVFDAVDGRACSDIEVVPFWDYSFTPGNIRKNLRGGEQGCLASFLSLFMSEAYFDVGYFFLEDDAVMDSQGFKAMSDIMIRNANKSHVYYGSRVYAKGLPDLSDNVSDERRSEGRVLPGWCDVLSPNYSNSLFAITKQGRMSLRKWIGTLKSKGHHLLPADDLLSIACNVHPGLKKPPMSETWPTECLAKPLLGFAPTHALSTRISSFSDTERRHPLPASDKQDCSLILE